MLNSGFIVSLVARQYGITLILFYNLKRPMNNDGESAIAAGDMVSAFPRPKHWRKTKQLEKMLGRKMMEALIFRDAPEIAQIKVEIAHAIAVTGQYLSFE
ncbi:hypothetical protein [Type-D symbiont of Plautia stali]|uniref:hypothetical protein n=1 Tax=Type-D symbiont of Plautia stali TaxID=1560356 RepID=UPI00128EA75D|nr:hypothetical protein [Type-D symbiont of Plautia stali]